MSSPFEELGKITVESETSGKGARTISSGKGDFGGKSYGSFQLSSSKGTLQRFLKATGYESSFRGLKPGTKEFNSMWEYLAVNDPDFEREEREFIMNTHYTPMVKRLEAEGIDLTGRSLGVHELVFSTATQYGPGHSVIADALRGRDVNILSDEELIDIVSDYKMRNVNTHFRNSDAKVRRGVYNRFVRERDELLSVSKEYKDMMLAGDTTENKKKSTRSPLERVGAVFTDWGGGEADEEDQVYEPEDLLNFSDDTPTFSEAEARAKQLDYRIAGDEELYDYEEEEYEEEEEEEEEEIIYEDEDELYDSEDVQELAVEEETPSPSKLIVPQLDSDPTKVGTLEELTPAVNQLITQEDFAASTHADKLQALNDIVSQKSDWDSVSTEKLKAIANKLWEAAPEEDRKNAIDYIYSTGLPQFLPEDKTEDLKAIAQQNKTKLRESLKFNGIHPALLDKHIDDVFEDSIEAEAAKRAYKERGLIGSIAAVPVEFVRGAAQGYNSALAQIATLVGADDVAQNLRTYTDNILPRHLDYEYELDSEGNFILDDNGELKPSDKGMAVHTLGQIGSFFAGGAMLKLAGVGVPATVAAFNGAFALASMDEAYVQVKDITGDDVLAREASIDTLPYSVAAGVLDTLALYSGNYWLKGLSTQAKQQAIRSMMMNLGTDAILAGTANTIQAQGVSGAVSDATGVEQDPALAEAFGLGAAASTVLSVFNIRGYREARRAYDSNEKLRQAVIDNMLAAEKQAKASSIRAAQAATNAKAELANRANDFVTQNIDSITPIYPTQIETAPRKAGIKGREILIHPNVDTPRVLKLDAELTDFTATRADETVLEYADIKDIPSLLLDIHQVGVERLGDNKIRVFRREPYKLPLQESLEAIEPLIRQEADFLAANPMLDADVTVSSLAGNLKDLRDRRRIMEILNPEIFQLDNQLTRAQQATEAAGKQYASLARQLNEATNPAIRADAQVQLELAHKRLNKARQEELNIRRVKEQQYPDTDTQEYSRISKNIDDIESTLRRISDAGGVAAYNEKARAADSRLQDLYEQKLRLAYDQVIPPGDVQAPPAALRLETPLGTRYAVAQDGRWAIVDANTRVLADGHPTLREALKTMKLQDMIDADYVKALQQREEGTKRGKPTTPKKKSNKKATKKSKKAAKEKESPASKLTTEEGARELGLSRPLLYTDDNTMFSRTSDGTLDMREQPVLSNTHRAAELRRALAPQYNSATEGYARPIFPDDQLVMPPSSIHYGEPLSREQVMSALNTAHEIFNKGFGFSQGGVLAGQGVLGYYEPGRQVTRVRNINDIPTAAHELMHRMINYIGADKGSLNELPDNIKKQAIDFALATYGNTAHINKLPAHKQIEEGLTTFAQSMAQGLPVPRDIYNWWITTAAEQYPDAYKAMTAALDVAKSYYSQGLERQVAGFVQGKKPSTVERVASWVRNNLTTFQGVRKLLSESAVTLENIDDAEAMMLARKNGYKGDSIYDALIFLDKNNIEVPTGSKKYYDANKHRAQGLVKGWLEYDIRDLEGNIQDQRALNDVFKDLTPMGKAHAINYMVAKRMDTLFKGADPASRPDMPSNIDMFREYVYLTENNPKGVGVSSDPMMTEGIVATNQEIVRRAQVFWELHTKIIDGLRGASYHMDAQLSKMMMNNYAETGTVHGYYLPFERVGMGDIDAFKRLTGSERSIENPLKTYAKVLTHLTSMAFDTGRMEIIMRQGTLHHEDPLIGYHIRPIGDQAIVEHIESVIAKKTKSILDAAQTMAEKIEGKKLSDADIKKIEEVVEDAMGMYHNLNLPAADNYVIKKYYTPEGTKYFEVHKDVIKATDTSINYLFNNPVFNYLAYAPKVTLQTFATSLSAAFQLGSNPIRDFIGSYRKSNTYNPLLHLQRLMWGWGQSAAMNVGAAGADTLAHRLTSMGVTYSTMRNQDFYDLRFKKMGYTVENVASKAWNKLMDITAISEQGPRLAAANARMEELGVSPTSNWTKAQAVEIIKAYQEATTNYGRSGIIGRNLNRGIPFFSARIAELDQTIEDLQGRRGVKVQKKAWAQLSAWTAFGYYMYMQNRDKDWYQELDPLDRGMQVLWETDVNGEKRLLKLPLDSISFLGYSIGQAINVLDDEDETMPEWYEWVNAMIRGVTPVDIDITSARSTAEALMSSFGPIVKEAIQQYANRDFYRGREIESKGIQAAFPRPGDRATPYTSSLATWIGDNLNRSPVRIDHLIKSLVPAASQYMGIYDRNFVEDKMRGEDQKGFTAAFMNMYLYWKPAEAIADRSERLLYDTKDMLEMNRNYETKEERKARLQLNRVTQTVANAKLLLTQADLSAEEKSQLTAVHKEALEQAKKIVNEGPVYNLRVQLKREAKALRDQRKQEQRARRGVDSEASSAILQRPSQ